MGYLPYPVNIEKYCVAQMTLDGKYTRCRCPKRCKIHPKKKGKK